MNAGNSIEQIARAVLYEGFLLYPYRLSSVKNRNRWNFGVLYPELYAPSVSERSSAQTECLVQIAPNALLDVRIRFLYLDEGEPVESEIFEAELDIESLTHSPHGALFSFGEVEGQLQARAQKTETGAFQLTIRIANLGQYGGQCRDEALRRSLLSTHAILTIRGGRFISMIDTPEPFRADASRCRNDGLWPVLVGANDGQMLCAPIILYDHPRIASQSPGDLFDATEIDEILTLRIQTLTTAEKAEMSGADPRTRALLERSEALTRAEMSSLHAPMHRETTDGHALPLAQVHTSSEERRPGSPSASQANGNHAAALSPFKKGDHVRLYPRRRADIFDLALKGKRATIVSVEQDVEDRVHLCVTVDDDPGRDLGAEGKPGHRFFFAADEVEPA